VIRSAEAGLVIDGSDHEIANALRIVLNDRDRARAMGDRGRIAAERFDVARIAEEVASTYERIVQQRSSLRSGRESPAR
jgi:glycosyltransferase involved in cell wall biosynthesis